LTEVEDLLARVDAALVDADAELSTDLGGHHERTNARIWRGQVLVDWDPDTAAGGCLLRADLLRRLIALHAVATVESGSLRINAPGRIVAALSPEHARLVARLGGARRIELQAILSFEADEYRRGEETYYLVERGQRSRLLWLSAQVSQRKSRAPT
jgi:hypothetical protein